MRKASICFNLLAQACFRARVEFCSRVAKSIDFLLKLAPEQKTFTCSSDQNLLQLEQDSPIEIFAKRGSPSLLAVCGIITCFDWSKNPKLSGSFWSKQEKALEQEKALAAILKSKQILALEQASVSANNNGLGIIS